MPRNKFFTLCIWILCVAISLAELAAAFSAFDRNVRDEERDEWSRSVAASDGVGQYHTAKKQPGKRIMPPMILLDAASTLADMSRDAREETLEQAITNVALQVQDTLDELYSDALQANAIDALRSGANHLETLLGNNDHGKRDVYGGFRFSLKERLDAFPYLESAVKRSKENSTPEQGAMMRKRWAHCRRRKRDAKMMMCMPSISALMSRAQAQRMNAANRNIQQNMQEGRNLLNTLG